MPQAIAGLLPGLLVLIVFSGAGYLLITITRAATQLVVSEAEDGALSGNASMVSLEQSTGASGSAVVRFNATVVQPPPPNPTPTPPPLVAPPTPAAPKIFTGGNDVALTWIPQGYKGVWAPGYNVYRNGIKVATTAMDQKADGLRTGSQYIDAAIIAGQTYKYQIQTIAPNDNLSALGPATSVTVPANTAVPNVVVDASVGKYLPAASSWMLAYGTPVIKTWYPKIAKLFATPDYAPSSTITIKALDTATFNSKYGPFPAAVTIGAEMILDQEYFQDPNSFGYLAYVLVHESTHILQYYDNGIFNGTTPRWFVEGMADYASFEVYNAYPYQTDALEQSTKPDSYYTDRYQPSANFLRWLNKQYNADYIRNGNIASHNGTFNASYTHFADGRNLDQAWGLFRGTNTRTGTFKSVSSGKCLDDAGADMKLGNKIILYPCNGNDAQKITYHPKAGSSTYKLTVLGHCIEAADGGTANATTIWINNCGSTKVGQDWVLRSDRSLFNPNSGRCLEITNGGTESPNGARIQLWDCNGGNWQKWTLP